MKKFIFFNKMIINKFYLSIAFKKDKKEFILISENSSSNKFGFKNQARRECVMLLGENIEFVSPDATLQIV